MRGELPVRPGYDSYQPYPSTRDMNRVDAVTLHYTAGPVGQTWLQIANYQIGPEPRDKFPAIAYHMGVDEVGDYHLFHDLDRYVWHSAGPGANETSIGIVYTGTSRPNPRQIEGLRAALNYCEDVLGRLLKLRGHKDNYATECPGPFWPAWKSEIRPG